VPGALEDNNPSDVELFLLGMDHRTGSRAAAQDVRFAEPAGPIGLDR
jgi:hypothetical protein